jgi:hypothetical protein
MFFKEQNHSHILVKLNVASPNTHMLNTSNDRFGHHLPRHPANKKLNLHAALWAAL